MGSKYRWFDFADSRNLQGDDATVERLGQRQGITGASSPLPGKPAASPSLSKSKTSSKVMGESRAHTAGEIEAADRNAVGGKRDKCKKGKSCSATCIYYMDDCIVDLDAAVGVQVSRVRDMLQEQVKRGAITEEEASTVFQKHLGVQDITKFGNKSELLRKNEKGDIVLNPDFAKKLPDLKKNVKEFDAQVDNIRKTKGDKRVQEIMDIVIPTLVPAAREKISMTPPEALEYIQANKHKFEKLNSIYDELRALHKEGKLTPEVANERLKEANALLKPQLGKFDLDDQKLAAALLTPLERSYFSKAGALTEGGGLFRAGDEVPRAHGDLSKASAEEQRARVLMGAKIILESNGKNTYTGQPLRVLESDWEHMVPFEAIGKNAEVFNNIGLVTSRENGGKSDKAPSWLYDTGPNGFMKGMKFDSEGKLTPESRAEWLKREEKKLLVKDLKEKGFKVSYDLEGKERAEAVKAVLATVAASKLSSDEKLQVMNKISLGFLLNTDKTFAETAGGGVQTHGRADKRWYYFGKENADFARYISNRLLYEEERGNTQAISKIGEIMRSTIGNRLNSEMLSQIGANFKFKGKNVVKLGDEVTAEATRILGDLSKETVKQIEAEFGPMS